MRLSASRLLAGGLLAMSLGLAPALAESASAAPARPSHAGSEAVWLAHVTLTPDGSHLIGNPDAPVKLVEYMSYTCPHCAHFEAEGMPRLRLTGLASGKVSLEVRHFLRDPVDTTVALLTNCAPPQRFFGLHDLFLRTQPKWLAEASKHAGDQQQRWFNGPMPQRMRAIAGDLGFYDLMESQGIGRVAADRCLANEAMLKKLAEQTARASTPSFEGTPSFAINGLMLAGTHDWNSLEPQLNARL